MSERRWRGRRGGSWLLAATGLFLLVPMHAQAHTPIKGAGEIVSGLLHPFLTPAHVLVLLSLGLLLGQRLPLCLQWPLMVFAAFAAVGLSVTAIHTIAGVPQPILVTLGLCAGGLVALAAPLPAWARLTACATAGLALGLDSGPDPGVMGVVTAKTLLATWVSLIFFVGDIAYYSSRLPSYQWVQTGVRVVGSWIVAIALLMLAFALRR